MTDYPVQVRGLTKVFGTVVAVDDLSFTVEPGRVTGFLGPNGAGKTTTLRVVLGLVAPTRGTATVGGLRYADLADPTRTVGAALEATGFHAGRRARDHLRVLAAAAGLPDRRPDEVLALVGLDSAADRRVGGFSLGMRQRLALASAMLGNPRVLLFDEPANGLDPEGIAWLRGFLRYLAADGRTVLVSSHVLSEVAQTVDDVVIIDHGRLVRQAPLAELEGGPSTLVRTPDPDGLRRALAAADGPAGPSGHAGPAGALDPVAEPDGSLRVPGRSPAEVGAAAFRGGVELHELRALASDLESIYFALTRDHEAGEVPR